MGARSDIDRLIELGLNRYGAGDLDGALLFWEEALAIDPDNSRATGYIDYVRHHYELLSAAEPAVVSGLDVPFGIEEEPEYQIEIVPGELEHRDGTAMAPEGIDGGWFDDEATHDVSAVLAQNEPPPVELELEAELPPQPEVNFEDATREYYGAPTVAAPVHREMPSVELPAVELDAANETDFSEAGTSEFQQAAEFHQDQFTGGFQPEGTPVGFSTQETEIRKRDLGFVQPTSAPQAESEPPPDPAVGTPTVDNLTLGDYPAERPSAPEVTLSGEKTLERGPSTQEHHDEDDSDLLEGLPVPGRSASITDLETQDIPILSSKAITKEMPDTGRPPSSKAVTRELPDSHRPPARRDSAELSQAEALMTAAPTRDFNPAKIDISAPTRELGIRPPAKRPGTLPNPVDEDAPTKQSDVRAIRDTARDHGRAQSLVETTKNDIMSPFDPIDQRAAQILDEVDVDAPIGEPHDDQTRRRIGALLERAVAWNQAGDTERAVTAVDLALNEDPNSALGQKLITRNRDTIMQVFQGYLGDLDRQPQLAKPLHELQSAPISPRAAFLLSRIDGSLTIDELLDVSGMPRLEAYRHLCQLYLRGILR